MRRSLLSFDFMHLYRFNDVPRAGKESKSVSLAIEVERDARTDEHHAHRSQIFNQLKGKAEKLRREPVVLREKRQSIIRDNEQTIHAIPDILLIPEFPGLLQNDCLVSSFIARSGNFGGLGFP